MHFGSAEMRNKVYFTDDHDACTVRLRSAQTTEPTFGSVYTSIIIVPMTPFIIDSGPRRSAAMLCSDGLDGRLFQFIRHAPNHNVRQS